MSADRSFHVPTDRHYLDGHHVWARHDGGTARVGIDAIGLQSLGELAYVALRDVGTRVARGDPIGTLEAAKMTTHIVAPVSGTITARNQAVLHDPSRVNGDPYDGGWLVEIEPADWDAESTRLVSGDAVVAWAAAAAARLSDEADREG